VRCELGEVDQLGREMRCEVTGATFEVQVWIDPKLLESKTLIGQEWID